MLADIREAVGAIDPELAGELDHAPDADLRVIRMIFLLFAQKQRNGIHA